VVIGEVFLTQRARRVRISDKRLVIVEWWVGSCAPHSRDALTRRLVTRDWLLGSGEWGAVSGDWFPHLRDALTRGLGIRGGSAQD
jgi:hypothetical protein